MFILDELQELRDFENSVRSSLAPIESRLKVLEETSADDTDKDAQSELSLVQCSRSDSSSPEQPAISAFTALIQNVVQTTGRVAGLGAPLVPPPVFLQCALTGVTMWNARCAKL